MAFNLNPNPNDPMNREQVIGPLDQVKQRLKPGDVVKIKSSFQRMTVAKVWYDDNPFVVECLWFDAHNRMHRQGVEVAALEVVNA